MRNIVVEIERLLNEKWYKTAVEFQLIYKSNVTY